MLADDTPKLAEPARVRRKRPGAGRICADFGRHRPTIGRVPNLLERNPNFVDPGLGRRRNPKLADHVTKFVL